jgi:hypothetical protein
LTTRPKRGKLSDVGAKRTGIADGTVKKGSFGYAVPLVLGCAGALYLFYSRYYFVGYFNDDAYYVLGARSLLQGAYADLSRPDRPPMTLYAPGFPLFLAPLAALVAPHWELLMLAAVAVCAASALALRRLFEGWLKPGALAALVAFYALNGTVAMAAPWVMSDLFFTLLSLVFFAQMRRALARKAAADGWLLGAILGWALVSRPTGLILFPAAAGGLLYARRRDLAWRALGLGLAPWAALLLRNHAATGSASAYLASWNGSAASIRALPALLDNAQRVANLFFVAVPFRIALPYAPWGMAASAAFVLAAAVFCARAARAIAARGRNEAAVVGAVAIFLAADFSVHAAYSAIDARYALPFLPYLFGFLAAGAQSLGSGARRAASALAAGAILWTNFSVQRQTALAAERPERRFPEKTFDWIRRGTPSDAVILSPRSALIFLYTGRRAVVDYDGEAGGPAELRRELAAEGISFVAQTRLPAIYLEGFSGRVGERLARRAQMLASSPRDFPPVFSAPDEAMTVYAVGP